MEPTLTPQIIQQQMEEQRSLWAKCNQDHVFKWADSLSDNARALFLQDLKQINITDVQRVYQETVSLEGISMCEILLNAKCALFCREKQTACTRNKAIPQCNEVFRCKQGTKEQMAAGGLYLNS